MIVLADSGYDDKKIEQTIVNKRWTFMIALKKTRSVKSETRYLTTPLSRQWCPIATFFRNHRRLKWTTIRVMTNGRKRKRMEFRIRHTLGYLRYVGQVRLVCSEPRKRPDGRRKYFACNDGKATARHIVLGYRLRWAVELFHKEPKLPPIEIHGLLPHIDSEITHFTSGGVSPWTTKLSRRSVCVTIC